MRTARSRIRTFAALAAVPIVLAGCRDADLPVATPSGAPDEALGSGVTQVAVFNDPYIDGTEWDDYTIHDRVRGLVQNTASGDTIRAAIFSLTQTSLVTDLINAQARGVNVYVVHSGHSFGTEEQRLAAALGHRFVQCRGAAADVDACISNRSSSLMHSKFYLFSRTVDRGVTKTRALAVTSANPTYEQANHYNNLVIIGGDVPAYDGFRRVFDDMYYLRKNNDYRDTVNGNWESAGAQIEAYFFPQADSYGGTTEQASTDQVALTLNPFTAGSGCFVKAAQATFTSGRDPIVQELVRLRKAGCTVQLAYNAINSNVKIQLDTVGVQLRLVHAAHSNSATVTQVHSKYYIVYGTYYGTPGVYRLFTGSQNWTSSGLRLNDEVLVKFREQPIVDAFINNFTMIWNRGVAQ